MIQQSDGNLLVVKERPVFAWVAGGVTSLISLALFTSPGGWIEGLVSLVAGLGMLLLTSVNIITLDKNRNRFSLQRRFLWRTFTQEARLDEIATFKLEANQYGEGGRTYRVVAMRTDGQSIPFTAAYTAGHERKRRRAAQLNQWLAAAQPAIRGSLTAPAAPANLPGAPAEMHSGETDGVAWQMQLLQVGEAPITRWFSPEFKMEAGFLLLAQKPQGMRLPGKLLGSLGRMFGEQALSLYGFSPADTPGIGSASPLEPSEPRLEPYYLTLTSNPLAARQVLNPWAIPLLVAWAERNPLQPVDTAQSPAQLVALFSPQGVYLAALRSQAAVEQEALSHLGVDLVRAQGV